MEFGNINLMKRILLLVLFFSSFGLSADSSKTLTINNLDISVTGEYKVEVYKGAKHMFSFDCRPYILCEIFTTTKQDPSYKLSDGRVYASDDLKSLAISNTSTTVIIFWFGHSVPIPIPFFSVQCNATSFSIDCVHSAVTISCCRCRYGYKEPNIAVIEVGVIPNDFLNILYCQRF